MDDQKQVWLDFSKTISVDHIKKSFHNPSTFQAEFNSILQNIVEKNNFSSAIEIGCEAGINLMLLSRYVKKSTFFDYDDTILEKVKLATDGLKLENCEFICEDMFVMGSIEDETYDLVFNSGVIEHYTKDVRTAATKSYARITKKGGYVIIAYPNHHSLPYRLSYLMGRAIGKSVWPFPKEYKFYSMKDEMTAAGLEFLTRTTVDRFTIFNRWINRYKITRGFFLFLDKFCHFGGYLTICIAKKPA